MKHLLLLLLGTTAAHSSDHLKASSIDHDGEEAGREFLPKLSFSAQDYFQKKGDGVFDFLRFAVLLFIVLDFVDGAVL